MSSFEASKVLQVCLSPSWGGLEMVALDMALSLTEHQIPVITACIDGSPLEQHLRQKNLPSVSFPRPAKYWSPSTVLKLRQLLKEQNFSSTLIQRLTDLWYVRPALIGFDQIRCVGVSHTLLSVNKKDLVHKWLYHRVNMMVALTNTHKKNLLENLPLTDPQITVIPNGVDISRFSPDKRNNPPKALRNLGSDIFKVGIVSRLDHGKGLLAAVRGLHELRQQGARFHCHIIGGETVGEEGFYSRLTEEIKKYDLQNGITLLPFSENIENFIAHFDVLLMPSPKETFGRVLIEAMACAVPVLAIAAGGVPDIITSGQEGLLIPPDQNEEKTGLLLGSALMSLYTQKDLREAMGAAGRTKALEIYDLNKIERFLADIIGGDDKAVTFGPNKKNQSA